MRTSNLDDYINDLDLRLLSRDDAVNIQGGGWLDSLIGAAFSTLGNWLASLFNDGLEIN